MFSSVLLYLLPCTQPFSPFSISSAALGIFLHSPSTPYSSFLNGLPESFILESPWSFHKNAWLCLHSYSLLWPLRDQLLSDYMANTPREKESITVLDSWESYYPSLIILRQSGHFPIPVFHWPQNFSWAVLAVFQFSVLRGLHKIVYQHNYTQDILVQSNSSIAIC